MGRELLGQALVRDIGLGNNEQSGRVLVDPMHDPGTSDTADARELACAMVQQCIDQCSIKVACRGVDNQAGGLLDNQEMFVLENDVERNVLWLIVRGLDLGHGNANFLLSTNLGGRIADRFALRFDGSAANEILQAFTRKRWNDICERAVEPPARMHGPQANVDRLRTPHEVGYGFRTAPVQCRRLETCFTLNSAASPGVMNPVDLASLLCSRLCHDLMSPVGALNNGIELMADEQDPEMREKCLELLADSARASANKLKFFRIAFGAAGGFAEDIDTHEAEVTLEGVFGAERRIELGWAVSDGKLPKGAVKLLLNLALLAGDALVRGGRLDVGAEARDGEIEMVIRAEGPRILLDPVLRDTLVTGGGSTVEPRAAGAWLAHSLATEAGGTIQLSDPSSPVLMIGVVIPRSS